MRASTSATRLSSWRYSAALCIWKLVRRSYDLFEKSRWPAYIHPRQKCSAAGVNGGVGRWMSAVAGRNSFGLRSTEAKYGERETRTNRCAVKMTVEDRLSSDASELSDAFPESSGDSRCTRTSQYSLLVHMYVKSWPSLSLRSSRFPRRPRESRTLDDPSGSLIHSTTSPKPSPVYSHSSWARKSSGASSCRSLRTPSDPAPPSVGARSVPSLSVVSTERVLAPRLPKGLGVARREVPEERYGEEEDREVGERENAIFFTVLIKYRSLNASECQQGGASTLQRTRSTDIDERCGQ